MLKFLFDNTIDIVKPNFEPAWIGKQLVTERERQKLELDDAAKKVQIDAKYLEDLETGEWDSLYGGKSVGIRLAKEYSEKLGLNPIEIFFGDGKTFLKCLIQSNLLELIVASLIACVLVVAILWRSDLIENVKKLVSENEIVSSTSTSILVPTPTYTSTSFPTATSLPTAMPSPIHKLVKELVLPITDTVTLTITPSPTPLPSPTFTPAITPPASISTSSTTAFTVPKTLDSNLRVRSVPEISGNIIGEILPGERGELIELTPVVGENTWWFQIKYCSNPTDEVTCIEGWSACKNPNSEEYDPLMEFSSAELTTQCQSTEYNQQ